MNKIISFEITEDDIQYLLDRASFCLHRISKLKDKAEKVRYWQMYNNYYELFLANKDRIKLKK